jgi:hypothetical protein
MNMPGFTAEASLDRATEFYRTLPIGGQIQRARVLPQLTLTYEVRTRCTIQFCFLTIERDVPPTFTCGTPQNICAHPGGDGGVLSQ